MDFPESCLSRECLRFTSLSVLSFQYQRGRRPEREKWVLGLFDTQYAPARPYLQIVPRRNAQTLLPIIGRKVAPGSVLHTDCWAAYNRARRALRLQHFTINHSENFVDPVTRVHTQNAESGWNVAKWKFKKMRGNTNPQFLQEYLQEFMWRRWYGSTHIGNHFGRFLEDLAEQIPV